MGYFSYRSCIMCISRFLVKLINLKEIFDRWSPHHHLSLIFFQILIKHACLYIKSTLIQYLPTQYFSVNHKIVAKGRENLSSHYCSENMAHVSDKVRTVVEMPFGCLTSGIMHGPWSAVFGFLSDWRLVELVHSVATNYLPLLFWEHHPMFSDYSGSYDT